MKTLLMALLATSLTLAACGKAQPAPTPTATVYPTNTPVATSTPIPTAALPTLTPTPTPEPAVVFLDWLHANGYEFMGDVNGGGKRYAPTDDESTFVIDVYPSSVVAWDIITDSSKAATTLHKATTVIINAVVAHGLDAEPLRAALSSPHSFPLALQMPDYSFLLEVSNHSSGIVRYDSVTARVEFLD